LNGTFRTFLVFAMLLLLAGSATVADTSKSCDIALGFDFRPGETATVGVLTRLTIGEGIEIAADIEVSDPSDPRGDRLGVVGVLGSVDWEGGVDEPIHLEAQVSSASREEIAEIIQSGLDGTSVEFGFAVYEWDQDESKYYLSFHDDGEVLFGEILASGTELAIAIADDASEEVMPPMNFTLSVSILPVGRNELHLAWGVSSMFARRWGVEQGQ
jgi:hypothetical protein